MERRKAILDAAEALLAEQGYEAATLKAAGERAGIPIASMYHYFADRYQVDAELLQRHLGELDRLIGATLAEPRAQTLREAVDVMIDLLLDYLRRHRSCTELWFAGRHTTLDEMVRAFDEAQAERLWRHLVEQRLVPADTPLLVLLLAFEVGTRLFDIAFRRSPAGDDAIIDEARRLVTAYLETYVSKGTR
ncbi:TetR/AcrR family transcriptional regulator [Streptomyces sp. NBC_01353]|uniref:TetR/AcrR family transcriptional regulator n=1 Tax=Streptomyces sp. NBC_01353 TaxID=2903835 RepID=UPI002E330241|nr:TetR/AcrR family transcriptional regulator [Streptomyces sp. NBC_01353]